MILKNLLFIIAIITCGISSAQSCLTLQFERKIGDEIFISHSLWQYYSDFKSSSYEGIVTLNANDTVVTKEVQYNENGNVNARVTNFYLNLVTDEEPMVFKNFEDKEMYDFHFVIGHETFPIEIAPLQEYEWKIEPERDTILNFPVQRATTKLKNNKEFEAWFTMEIPWSDGLGDYHGLPGMILKVNQINSNEIWIDEVTQIEISQKVCEPRNPLVIYPNATIISSDEAKEKMEKFNQNREKYQRSK